MEKYRFDHQYDSVYVYSQADGAYIYCGRMMGRAEEQFVRDYEQEGCAESMADNDC